MTNFKMTVRADHAVSAYNPLPQLFKNTCPLFVSGDWGVGLWKKTTPVPWLPASKIKQTLCVSYSVVSDSL